MIKINPVAPTSAPGPAADPMGPLLTAVVGTSGNPEAMMRCLQSVIDTCAAAGRVEIIVLDNGSVDQTHAVVQSLGSSVVAIRSEIKTDWPSMWMRGAERATGTAVAFISDDIELSSGWLPTAFGAIMSDTSSPAATPSIRSGSELISTAPLSEGEGVCLIARRDRLDDGSITEVRLVADSIVERHAGALPAPVLDTTSPLKAATITEITRASVDEARAAIRGSGIAQPKMAPAPGGGAPKQERRWFGDAALEGSTPNPRWLHLGCGSNFLYGWTNVDGDPACGPDMVADLVAGLPVANDSIDRIYSEHLFEHFELADGIRLMRECLRALAPGGVMRIAMPDLHEAVIDYLNGYKTVEWAGWFPEIDSDARMINMTMHAWGHLYLYDHKELEMRLAEAGFTSARPAPWGRSQFPELCNLETRKQSSLVWEAKKIQ